MVPVDMKCQEFVELVTDYMEGSLPAASRVDFEAHILECDGCEAYLDQMRQTMQAIGRLSERDIEPEALARMLELFNDWRTQPDHRGP